MATKQELEMELAQAREQLAQMSAISSPSQDLGGMMMEEMARLNKTAGRSIHNTIPYREIDDHKNIPLYTELNKVIGPMHPANAKQTMERFYAAGYPLFTMPRTPEQIEAYKQTDRYKKRQALRDREQARKHNKKPGVQIEKFARTIARETRQSVDELTVLPEKK